MPGLIDTLPRTETMPALFLGHGSPENALADNPFTRSLTALGAALPRPSAVLVVSAHWLTRGTRVLCVREPRTIHDFYGFPPELYEVNYPAPGGIESARAAGWLLGVDCDSAWGLDHASWAVLRHVYPDADVPVFELSLDASAPPEVHYALAKRLAPLRDHGVMVVGSGNIVHNLHAVVWSEDAAPYEWAIEFDEWVTARLEAGDGEALARYESLGRRADLAAPTNEHFLPLLYVAALRRAGEPLAFTHQGIELGSVSMRCLRIG